MCLETLVATLTGKRRCDAHRVTSKTRSLVSQTDLSFESYEFFPVLKPLRVTLRYPDNLKQCNLSQINRGLRLG